MYRADLTALSVQSGFFALTDWSDGMKVAIDAQTFLRQRTGGISRLFTDLIREFDEDGSLGVSAVLPFRITNNALLPAAIPRRGLRTTPEWLPRGLLYGPAWIRGRRIKGEPDVVHHTYYSRRFLGAPPGATQVTTVYDMIPELFAGTKGFTATHLAKRAYVEASDLVICISESTRQDMEQVFGDVAQESVVIPLGVESGFQPGLQPLKGLPHQYLLYVGRRDGYKDFRLLPRALEFLRHEGLDVPLVVVGAPLTTAELTEFRRRGLENAVMQVSLGDEELRRAMSNSTAVVQTSRYEGFGLTPLEGMASGVPVVIAHASSMPEVGGDVAMYFQPGDPISLATAISQVLADEATRADLGRRGVERAAHFSTNAMAKKTAMAYRSIVSRK